MMKFMPLFEPKGNLKDPEKIKADLDSKKQEWIDGAALDPLTGQVLAIGLLIGDEFICMDQNPSEAMMLHEFWDAIQGGAGILHHLIGFNCLMFDLPFLIRRSWKCGIQIPTGVRRGRYWGDQITDLRDVWQCGDRQAHGSLDTIAKHLGVGEKNGSGADFHKLWVTDKPKAISYLQNDLWLTAAIAKKLGVL